jgi:hypothetical protein
MKHKTEEIEKLKLFKKKSKALITNSSQKIIEA